ncbi:MAG: hypothetical protein ACI4GD_11275 [Lachnospiraceae bacterium]
MKKKAAGILTLVLLTILIAFSYTGMNHTDTGKYIWKIIKTVHSQLNEGREGVTITVTPEFYGDYQYEIFLEYDNRIIRVPDVSAHFYSEDYEIPINGIYVNKDCIVEMYGDICIVRIYGQKEFSIVNNQGVYLTIIPNNTDDYWTEVYCEGQLCVQSDDSHMTISINKKELHSSRSYVYIMDSSNKESINPTGYYYTNYTSYDIRKKSDGRWSVFGGSDGIYTDECFFYEWLPEE